MMLCMVAASIVDIGVTMPGCCCFMASWLVGEVMRLDECAMMLTSDRYHLGKDMSELVLLVSWLMFYVVACVSFSALSFNSTRSALPRSFRSAVHLFCRGRCCDEWMQGISMVASNLG